MEPAGRYISKVEGDVVSAHVANEVTTVSTPRGLYHVEDGILKMNQQKEKIKHIRVCRTEGDSSRLLPDKETCSHASKLAHGVESGRMKKA